MHIEPVNIPRFRTPLHDTEDIDCIYDHNRTLKRFDSSIVVKATSILDEDRDRINVPFEGVACYSVQTALLDYVFAKAKYSASATDENEREQAILKEGEGDDAVHYWYKWAELDVD